jgi:hypothetical protein
VPEKVIKLINPWRKKETAKGSEAGLAMRQVYTQVRSTLPTMLKFQGTLMGRDLPIIFRGGSKDIL